MVMTTRAKNTPNFMVVIFHDFRNDLDSVKMIPIAAQSKTNLIFWLKIWGPPEWRLWSGFLDFAANKDLVLIFFFQRWVKPGLFYISFRLFVQKIILVLSQQDSIRTRIVGVEGEGSDHKTTSTAFICRILWLCRVHRSIIVNNCLVMFFWISIPWVKMIFKHILRQSRTNC